MKTLKTVITSILYMLIIGAAIFVSIQVSRTEGSRSIRLIVFCASAIIGAASLYFFVRNLYAYAKNYENVGKLSVVVNQIGFVAAVGMLFIVIWCHASKFLEVSVLSKVLLYVTPGLFIVNYFFIPDGKRLTFVLRNVFYSAIVASSLYGIRVVISESQATATLYHSFTFLTNVLLMLVAVVSFFAYLVLLVKKDDLKRCSFFYVLDHMAVVSALVTFLTVVTYLQWRPETYHLTWSIQNISLNYISPLCFIVVYLFLTNERSYKFRYSFAGALPLVIYGAYAFPLVSTGQWEDIYGFLNLAKMPAWQSAVTVIVFLVGAVVFSIALWLLKKVCFLIFTGEEVAVDEQPLSVVYETNEETPAFIADVHLAKAKKSTKKTSSSNSNSTSESATLRFQGESNEIANSKEVNEINEEEKALIKESQSKGHRVYHISHQSKTDMWQVKMASGQKAIKLFKTQAEAIAHAKRLVRTQGGSIRVHSVKGRIRKA